MNIVEPIRNKTDVQQICDYLKSKDSRYALIWEFGIHSGLRVSDILNLKISDVRDKEFIKIREQKTKKYKIFPIRDNLKCDIVDFLREYKNINRSQSDWLFLGDKGGKMHRSMVYRMINEAVNDLGLRIGNVGTHTMRKTFGYHHYKQFKDVATLQTIFNHSAPSITLRYIGITQDEINDSYQALTYEYEESEEYEDNYAVETPTIIKPSKKEQPIPSISNAELIKHLTKIETLLQKLVEEKPEKQNTNTIKFLHNYISSGAPRHRDFALLALEADID